MRWPCDDTKHEILFNYNKLYLQSYTEQTFSFSVQFKFLHRQYSQSQYPIIQLSSIRLRRRNILHLYSLRRSDHNRVWVPRVRRDINPIATRKEHIETLK